MSLRAWGLAGALAGAILSMLYFAPAAWLAQALYSASGQRVLLTQTEGRVWQGSAQLILLGGAQSQDASALPGRISWRLHPFGFKGLAIDLTASCCTAIPMVLIARAGWGFSGGYWQVDAARLDSQWPAAWLSGLGAPWNTLQLDGTLQLSSPEGLRWRQHGQRAEIQGGLILDVLNASSRISTLKPLGSYRLQIKGAPLSDGSSAQADGKASPAQAEVQLQTLQGALKLSGQGQCALLAHGVHFSFRGEASSSDSDLPLLSNLLNIIGRRQGNVALLSFN
jgi:general secretion pathway protein N